VQKTTVALTSQGRAALSTYTRALRDLLGGSDIDAASQGNTVYDMIEADKYRPTAHTGMDDLRAAAPRVRPVSSLP